MIDKCRLDDASVEAPVVNFIKDATAETDAFQSHSRIARAVASIISAKRELEVIGLLGPWGSGKSTVIDFTTRQLEMERPNERVLCFKYDAWLHQSDPPRRSFLEGLLRFLIDKGLTTEDRWSDDLAKLNRQIEDTEIRTTPTLSPAGKYLLPTLLLVPFGMQLFDKDWLDGFLQPGKPWIEYWGFLIGTILLCLPLIVAAGLWLSWRSWDSIGKAAFWKRRPPYESESIISIFMNKERKTDKSTTIRVPDPTTIEFQNIFRSILREVNVDGGGNSIRLVFVIDNLDRLPERAAVEMWATVRSFFLGDHRDFRLPTVILPIDEKAVERMYGVDHPAEDASKLAKSFMDKTFDLSFRVTPPVLSNWQNYITGQIEKMFGVMAKPDWAFIVGSIYRDWHSSQNDRQSITPRDINTILNRIGTLYTQWFDQNINFATIAAYAIHRAEIDADIFSAVRSPKWGAEKHDSNWALSIAAMHYGVPLENAAQVLLDERIREALDDVSGEELVGLCDVPGFDLVLHGIVSGVGLGSSLARAVLNISTLPDTDNHWRDAAWAALRRKQLERSGGEKISADDARAYNLLVDSVPADEESEYFSSLISYYSSIPGIAYSGSDVSRTIAGSIVHFAKAARQSGFDTTFNVKAPPNRYLAMLQELATDREVVAVIGCDSSDEGLIEALATSFGDKAPPFNRRWAVYGLQHCGRSIAWGGVVEAAAAQLRDTLGVSAADAAYTLGRLRAEAEAAKAIDALNANGELQTRFVEAYSPKSTIAPTIAALILISSSPGLLKPPEEQTWSSFLKADPAFAGKVADSLVAIGVTELGAYAKLSDVTNAPGDLLRRAVSSLFKSGRLKLPAPADIGANYEWFYQATTAEDDLPILESVCSSDDFWNAAHEANFGSIASALSILLSNENPYQERARALLKAKLEDVTEEAWSTAIGNDSFPMQMLDLTGGLPEIGGYLPGALRQAIPLLRSGDFALRKRWFILAEKVSKSVRKTLMKTVADSLVVPDYPNPRDILVGGDGMLVRDGDLHRHSDALVRNLILPMLSNHDDFVWLRDHAADLAKAVAKADADTRAALAEQLSATARRDDEARRNAEALQAGWGLPKLVLEVEGQETLTEGEEEIDPQTAPDQQS